MMEGIEENGTPRFATVVRGYDRMQVDDYVGHLHQWIEQADYRAQQCEAAAARAHAESEQFRRRLASVDAGTLTATPESMKALGDRVGNIMQSSFHTAEELRRRAEDAARVITEEAQETATRVVDAATARAQELSKAAEDLLVQAQEALAGANAAVASQVEEARKSATTEREQLLHKTRAQAKELAERSKAEEAVRREELAALEEHRRRVMEEISLLHERLGNIGEGLSLPVAASRPPVREAGGQQQDQQLQQRQQKQRTQTQQAEQQPGQQPDQQPDQRAADDSNGHDTGDETLVLDLPPGRQDRRRRVASSRR